MVTGKIAPHYLKIVAIKIKAIKREDKTHFIKKGLTGVFISTIALLLQSFSLCAQQQEGNTAPLELPNYIIEGKEQINVRSGFKQFPENPKPLGAQELDSLNSLEKQQSLILPSQPLQDRILSYNYRKGYFNGEFGMFTTAQFEVGYEFHPENYDIFGNAGLRHSSGHVKNSEYNQLYINILSDFIADTKFWIFGGSKTRTNISFNKKDYKLYAAPDPPDRNAMNINANVDCEGNYEGFLFKTGAGFRTMQLAQRDTHAFDNSICGYISIKKLTEKYELGGDVNIDLHSIRGDGVHFMQINAYAGYINKNLTIRLNAGFQAVRSSQSIERGGLVITGDMEYRLNKMLTIRGRILSGLSPNTLTGRIAENPYISTSALIDFAYDIPKISGILIFHPNEKMTATAGIDFSFTSRTPIYTSTDDAMFDLIYKKTNALEIFGEGYYYMTDKDIFNANLALNYSTLTDNGNLLPYTAPYRCSVDYKRMWTEKFGTNVGFSYIGIRYADVENTIRLSDYFNLQLSANYRLNDVFKFYVNFENLTNSEIFIWEGYKERGLFLSGGILWQFK